MGEVDGMAPDDKTREAVREWQDRCERRLVEVAREQSHAGQGDSEDGK
jgi:hypothetical protein